MAALCIHGVPEITYGHAIHASQMICGCLLDQWIFQLGGVYTASGSWTEIPGRT